MKLSVVIITHNEEQNIGRCIDSVQDIASEIIVLDSFSTDQTESICKAKGVIFQQRTWEGFSAAKNFANTLATGDVILSLDADEALSPQLRQNIKTTCETMHDDAYMINRLTQYCGTWIRHGGWYPDRKIRLFKRGICAWAGDVHENLIFTNTPAIARVQGDILHYSFSKIDTHIKKIMTYATLSARRDLDRGKRYNFVMHGVIKPWFAFINMYFFKRGFLDGFYGWVIACNSAFEKFLRYAKYVEIKRNNKNRSSLN